MKTTQLSLDFDSKKNLDQNSNARIVSIKSKQNKEIVGKISDFKRPEIDMSLYSTGLRKA